MTWKISASRKRIGWLIVIGPFSFAFKETLKELIPTAFRYWDDSLAAWVIDQRFRSVIEAVIREHAGEPSPATVTISDLHEDVANLGAPLVKGSDQIHAGLVLGIQELDPPTRLVEFHARSVSEDNRSLILIFAVAHHEE